MRSAMPVENNYALQTHWTEQFFQETERELCQVDFIESMQNVMFYATLLFQTQQERERKASVQVRLPFAWQWGGEEEIVAAVKQQVPSRYAPVLEYSLAASASEGRDAASVASDAGRLRPSETELREQAADFIRYVQERLQFPDERPVASRRTLYL